MEKQEIIIKVEEILNMKDDRSNKECVALIENLTKIAIQHDQNAVYNAFEKFLNYETLNYVSNEDLEDIELKMWSKDKIQAWLQQKNEPMCEDGTYNFNAIVLAMNYEYSAHKTFIESMGGNSATIAYQLAKEALQMDGYIDAVLEHYEKD